MKEMLQDLNLIIRKDIENITLEDIMILYDVYSIATTKVASNCLSFEKER